MNASTAFELVRRPPAARLAGAAQVLVGYHETGCLTGAETGAVALRQLEPAALVVPLIVSLGTPFHIALDRAPGAADRQPSFAAGLHAGSVHIASDGAAACVQMDLTPLGAHRLFGGALAELSGRMVDVGDLFGAAGRQLRERLGATADWSRRFDLLEEFVARRLGPRPSPEVVAAYRRLRASGGGVRIAHLAEELGWSRTRLASRFHAELGLAPKAVARIMRFRRACRLARRGDPGGWAGIAAEAGFADQAHLVREFGALAGEPPTAWAERLELTDQRLLRTFEDDDGG